MHPLSAFPIDITALDELYGDDYIYQQEVFSASLDELRSSRKDLENILPSADYVAAGRIVHKIKPVFGFTGFLQMQEQAQQFERGARNGTTSEGELKIQLSELLTNIHETENTIEAICQKLQKFNSGSL